MDKPETAIAPEGQHQRAISPFLARRSNAAKQGRIARRIFPSCLWHGTHLGLMEMIDTRFPDEDEPQGWDNI